MQGKRKEGRINSAPAKIFVLPFDTVIGTTRICQANNETQFKRSRFCRCLTSLQGSRALGFCVLRGCHSIRDESLIFIMHESWHCVAKILHCLTTYMAKYFFLGFTPFLPNEFRIPTALYFSIYISLLNIAYFFDTDI